MDREYGPNPSRAHRCDLRLFGPPSDHLMIDHMDAQIVAHRLQNRASRLRCESNGALSPLADAMRRRASELEFAAHILNEVTAPTTRVVYRAAS